jgi:hypothetical protein
MSLSNAGATALLFGAMLAEAISTNLLHTNMQVEMRFCRTCPSGDRKGHERAQNRLTAWEEAPYNVRHDN